MVKTSSELVAIALNEEGYLEKKSNKNLDSKTANAGSANYTKYNSVFGVNGCYWCCYFVMWCFYMLCGKTKAEARTLLCGTITGACETSRKAFINKKRYGSTPKVGALIFFKGTRHAGANHIGIVTSFDNNKVYTIEGNTSTGSGIIDNGGGVAKKSYARSNSKIMGYGYPMYEDSKSAQEIIANACPYSEPTKTIQKGSTGTGVKWLQWHLNKLIDLGIITGDKLSGTGTWASKTQDLFIKFQKKYPTTGTKKNGKWVPDGQCGSVCRTKIKSLVK